MTPCPSCPAIADLILAHARAHAVRTLGLCPSPASMFHVEQPPARGRNPASPRAEEARNRG